MDFDKGQGADSRQVGATTREGQPVRLVTASRVFPTTGENLWKTLTQAERLSGWFLPVKGRLEEGGHYELEGNAQGSILSCLPQDSFEVTWEFGGQVSWVRVTLETTAQGTCMTLDHQSPQDEAANRHWQQFGPAATGVGWDLSFLGLGLHLESGGQPIDQQASHGWMASDSGKAFMRASAEAWGAAHEASGVAADEARAMAGRTAAFYTGG